MINSIEHADEVMIDAAVVRVALLTNAAHLAVC
jgi:hypothetical protein